MGRALRFAFVLLLASACYDFHPVGPSEPAAVVTPGVVSVTVAYVQPFACLNVTSPCGGPVVFSASWMPPGGGFNLIPDAANHIWRGAALDVPVNFPPNGAPYQVRVFDPYLQDTSSQGFTAQRLTVGSQLVEFITGDGTPLEHGLVFIDANGVAHTPF